MCYCALGHGWSCCLVWLLGESCSCSSILNQIGSNWRTGKHFYTSLLVFMVVVLLTAGNEPWIIPCSLIAHVSLPLRSRAKTPYFSFLMKAPSMCENLGAISNEVLSAPTNDKSNAQSEWLPQVTDKFHQNDWFNPLFWESLCPVRKIKLMYLGRHLCVMPTLTTLPELWGKRATDFSKNNIKIKNLC